MAVKPQTVANLASKFDSLTKNKAGKPEPIETTWTFAFSYIHISVISATGKCCYPTF
jgi:hypothetical protein